MSALPLRALQCLRSMKKAREAADWDAAEIVREGSECWMGLERIAGRTLESLIRLTAVTREADGGMERFSINETGLAIVANPALADEILRRLLTMTPTGVTADGSVYDMTADGGDSRPGTKP